MAALDTILSLLGQLVELFQFVNIFVELLRLIGVPV